MVFQWNNCVTETLLTKIIHLTQVPIFVPSRVTLLLMIIITLKSTMREIYGLWLLFCVKCIKILCHCILSWLLPKFILYPTCVSNRHTQKIILTDSNESKNYIGTLELKTNFSLFGTIFRQIIFEILWNVISPKWLELLT